MFSTCENGSLTWYLYLAIAIMCRVAVPVFFMISGALFLGRQDEKLSGIYKKYILKNFIIFIVFGFLYYCNGLKNSTNTFDIIYFIKAVYSYDYNINYDISAHLWYLYGYIGFLAFMPFMRAMVQNLKTKYFYYLIVMAVLFSGVLPVMEYIVFDGRIAFSQLFRTSWILTDIFIYPCIGYFIQERLDMEKIKAKQIALLWAINCLCIGISCYMATSKGNADGEFGSQPFFKAFVVVNAITLFVTAKKIFERDFLRGKKIIISLGGATFGIYLVHVWVRQTDLCQNAYNHIVNILGNNMVSALLWSVFMMLVGYIITIIWKKIPILKKLVGG